MNTKSYYLCLIFSLVLNLGFTQNINDVLKIKIVDTEQAGIPFAEVFIKSGERGFATDAEGYLEIKVKSLPLKIWVSATGFQNKSIEIQNKSQLKNILKIELKTDILGLDEVVVTGTRNAISKRQSPVLVSTLSAKNLTQTQSNTLAEGLNFSPGVRVETNCQNCGFTQVRLNGLEGSYTQILVNSRPIFTSLLGVYGLEQIPANSIQNIEIVRSGGSSLYGSNAIAGTVNVITKDPVLNTWEIGSRFGIIDNQSTDIQLDFNTSVVADDLMSGMTLFGNYRTREDYDANNDGFSELVKMRSNSIGAKAYLKPNDLSRFSINLNTIKAYRRGGDQLDLAPQFTDITEELDHDTFLGGLSYDLNSSDQLKNLNAYTSFSHTNRDSYYGGLGGGRTRQDSISANNAFGNTKDLALNSGIKLTKKSNTGNSIIIGAEFNLNDTQDEIEGYNRLIDQNVKSYGLYAQYKFKLLDNLTSLLGARLDHIDVNGLYQIEDASRKVDIGQTAFSPRVTLAYDFTDNQKLRLGYARGFRAPQAFNEDLHISSVGGEQLFVILSEDLETEYSDAFTLSYDLDFTKKLAQFELLLEGFLTDLKNPFTQVSTGSTLTNNSILEEVRNGSGAQVYGLNIEFNYSPNPKFLFQTGVTLQDTSYDEAQILFESANPDFENVSINSFVRNPKLYGFLNFNYTPKDIWSLDASATYTGSMTVPRVVNSDGFIILNETQDFFDLNLRASRDFEIKNEFELSVFGGVKNIFNSYQNDFDVGPTRDSDYIYGPAAPRSVFIGVRFGG